MQKATVVLITLILYKLVLVTIGLWASKRSNSREDFFLAGRGLGPIVAALSYSSSAASAWALLGLSGIAYLYGLSTIWVPLGSIVSMLVVWFWLAPRLMSFSRQHDQITLTEVLVHKSMGPMRKIIVVCASVIIVFSFIFYIAAQFQGAGSTFATTFDMSMQKSIMLGAFIITVYTLLGGFWAVSMTDAVQGFLMALTAIILPIAAFFAVGGLDGLLQGLNQVSNSSQLSFIGGKTGLVALGVIIGGLSIGLGTFGQPHLMARVMALRDVKAMRDARNITIVWYLFVFLGMWFVGLVGHVLHNDITNSEEIFFVMLDDLFPPILGAIFLAAVLSAIMSTADSQLLSAAASIAHDLGLGGTDTKKLLLVSRISIVVLVIMAVIVAIYMPDKIFNRVLFAWLALGAAFGPTLFARLAGIQIKSLGILLSMLFGFFLTVLLSFFPNAPGDIIERLVPFCVATIILFIFKVKQE